MNLLDRIAHLTKREKHRVVLSVIGTLVAIGGYLFGTSHSPGLSSYIVAVPALFGISLTCLARVNDIGPDNKGLVWNTRRVALTITGAGSVAFMYAPFSATPTYPSWLMTVMVWGVFLTWVTTPLMPPWHKYISGEVKAFPSLRWKRK